MKIRNSQIPGFLTCHHVPRHCALGFCCVRHHRSTDLHGALFWWPPFGTNGQCSTTSLASSSPRGVLGSGACCTWHWHSWRKEENMRYVVCHVTLCLRPIVLSSHGTLVNSSWDELSIKLMRLLLRGQSHKSSQSNPGEVPQNDQSQHNLQTIRAEPFVLVHQAVCWFQILKGNVVCHFTGQGCCLRIALCAKCQQNANTSALGTRKSCHIPGPIDFLQVWENLHTVYTLGPKPTNKL